MKIKIIHCDGLSKTYATLRFGNCSAMKYAQFAVNCQKYGNPLVICIKVFMMNYFSNTAAKTAECSALLCSCFSNLICGR